MKFKNNNPEIVLIGAGIMSATLATFIKNLMPDARITIYERLNRVGAESSDAWNNAGTGHAAYCELNYTPQKEDGSIDVSKAFSISEQFEISKQFWAYLVKNHLIENDFKRQFITSIDHMSFVWGESNVQFLKTRYQALKNNPLFASMQYTEDRSEMMAWIPLMLEDRNDNEKLALTRMEEGTDVNFGQLTRLMIEYITYKNSEALKLHHEVETITKVDDGKWMLEIKNLDNGQTYRDICDFIFIGAGGGSLPLLEKTGIPESKGYGGFPVSGQWLKCNKKEIIERHDAKVYGKAAVGAPPMSVPHLDTRFINGEKALLFGPYAGFSTKFLKEGSYLDLFLSIEMHNVWPLITAGVKNIPLTKYLIEQVRQSPEDRLSALKDFYPNAKMEDWELVQAGQRVQIIKQEGEHGVLKFGTEVVTDKEGSVATLLGASPGASTSVSIILEILQTCFDEDFRSDEWQAKIKLMIPSFGESLSKNPELLAKVRDYSNYVLDLT